ncbi:pseudouridine synthase [Gillisia sp. Hel_I_29]|uniref:pseudouridine synthase n=1 Tax=Gillisia sp. Hel_I_29 TaxID=1249975 RepID=UPI000556D762|nr:pseudouridine synthase [Gillisia sp. Hel_I_29]
MQDHKHFKIYKPYGYLSQFINNQNSRRNKKLLGELSNFPEGIMAIGRLDEDSEGLLFLTTDGKMSEEVRGRKVEKEYYVQVDGVISNEAITHLQDGVLIGVNGTKYKTLPCKASRVEKVPNFPERSKKIRDERHGPTSWASITVTEGKFRQIKKMTAAVGFPTLRLVRVRIGNETIEDLQAGAIQEISSFSI